MITSIKLNGLEIGNSPHYAVAEATQAALLAGTPRKPIMVDRPGRAPKFIRSQVDPRTFSVGVFMLDKLLSDREGAFSDLVTAAGTGELVTFEITRTEPVQATLTWMIHCSGPVPDGHFYERTVVEAVAPDPEPVVT